jgi:hypothetical protein
MSSNIQGPGIVDENIDEYALIHISQITGRADLVAVRVDLGMGRSMLPLIQPSPALSSSLIGKMVRSLLMIYTW